MNANQWQALSWHEPQWRRLAASRAAGRLAHALLLAGPRGVGKRRFAARLAAWLLCETGGAEPCGDCRGCRQLRQGTHPNFFKLEPEEDKRDISVDAVRELSERLALTAHYGALKVAVIAPADALNANGVNALLKTIEEPPAGSHLLLLSERPMLLAPTLRSRCQILRFGTPPEAEALAWLRKADPDADEAALQAAHGAPLRAAELLEAGLAEQQTRWQSALLAVAAGRESPLALAERVDRDEARQFLEWLIGWLANIQAQRLTGVAAKSAPPLNPRATDRLLQAALDAQRRLHGSAQPQLTLESVIIDFWQACRSPAAVEELRV